MSLEKKPFRRYSEEKPSDKFTIRLNEDERLLLNKCKKVLEQEKDSTCMKQLAWVGANVIHDNKTAYLLGVIFANKRKNKRLGIVEFEV